jgi:hypothetical protein
MVGAGMARLGRSELGNLQRQLTLWQTPHSIQSVVEKSTRPLFSIKVASPSFGMRGLLANLELREVPNVYGSCPPNGRTLRWLSINALSHLRQLRRMTLNAVAATSIQVSAGSVRKSSFVCS